jgi:hypothetical protein
MKLSDKAIVVTGGAQGLGRACGGRQSSTRSGLLYIYYTQAIYSYLMRLQMNLKNLTALAVIICLSSTAVLAKKEKDKNKPLPQGLQMKLDRGGALPPGWQKKLVKGEVLEESVYNHGEVVIPIDSDGMLTVRIEGKLIKLIKATREIVEIFDSLNES